MARVGWEARSPSLRHCAKASPGWSNRSRRRRSPRSSSRIFRASAYWIASPRRRAQRRSSPRFLEARRARTAWLKADPPRSVGGQSRSDHRYQSLSLVCRLLVIDKHLRRRSHRAPAAPQLAANPTNIFLYNPPLFATILVGIAENLSATGVVAMSFWSVEASPDLCLAYPALRCPRFWRGSLHPDRLPALTPSAGHGLKHAMTPRTTFSAATIGRQIPRRKVVLITADQNRTA